MEVAVAGVTVADDGHLEPPRNLLDPAQDARHLAPGDDDVLVDLEGLEAGDGGRDGAPEFPDALPLGGVGRLQRDVPAVRFDLVQQADEIRLDVAGLAIDFHEEQRLRIGGYAVMQDVLHRPDGRPVHQLQRRGDDPRADDAGHGGARFLDRGEGDEQGAAHLGERQQLESELGDDRQRPLRTHQQPQEVVPHHVLDHLAAGGADGPVGQDEARAEHVVFGDAVFHRAQPAGAFGHIAAQRRGVGAGRIGGIEQAEGFDGVLQVLGDHARLDDGHQVVAVDFQDPVQPGHGHHDAAAGRNAAAGHPDAGAARRHRYPVAVTQCHDAGHRRFVRREHHQLRPLGRRLVHGVQRITDQRLGGVRHVLGTQQLAQRVSERSGQGHARAPAVKNVRAPSGTTRPRYPSGSPCSAVFTAAFSEAAGTSPVAATCSAGNSEIRWM